MQKLVWLIYGKYGNLCCSASFLARTGAAFFMRHSGSGCWLNDNLEIQPKIH